MVEIFIFLLTAIFGSVFFLMRSCNFFWKRIDGGRKDRMVSKDLVEAWRRDKKMVAIIVFFWSRRMVDLQPPLKIFPVPLFKDFITRVYSAFVLHPFRSSRIRSSCIGYTSLHIRCQQLRECRICLVLQPDHGQEHFRPLDGIQAGGHH